MSAFDKAWDVVKSSDWRIDGKKELEDLLSSQWDDYSVHPSSPESIEGSWRESMLGDNWVWKRPLIDQPRKTGYPPESLHLDTLPAWILYQSGYPIMPELSQEARGYGFPPAAVQPKGHQIAPIKDPVRCLPTGYHPDDEDAWTSWFASGGENNVPSDLSYLLSPYYSDITAQNVADFSRNPYLKNRKHDEYLFDALQAFDPFDNMDPTDEALGRADSILQDDPVLYSGHNHSEVIDRINENLWRLKGNEMKIDDVATLESMRRIAEALEDEGY